MISIEKYADKIKLPYLLHFTNIKNLPSIFEHGLCPREPGVRITSVSDAEAIKIFSNDNLRLDGHKNSVSLSIAFPNCKMFYRIRQDHEDDSFCILVLSKSILWNYECAFCKHNAADKLISSQDISSLMNVESFQGMYNEIDGIESRKDQKLKTFDPTDVQAEVLVFGTIKKSDIQGIVFPNSKTQADFTSHIKKVKTESTSNTENIKTVIHPENKFFYSDRKYTRKYYPEWQ